MRFKKHYFYLSASLFSAIILAPLATQTVQATTVTPVTGTAPNTATTNTPTTTTVNATTTTTTTPVTTGSNTSPTATTTTAAKTASPSDSTVTSAPATANTATTTPVSSPTTTTPKSTTTSSANPTAVTTPSTTSTTTTATISIKPGSVPTSPEYTVPNNLPDSTIINFTDPLLGAVVKQELKIKSTDPITAGAIRTFNSNYFNASETSYLVGQTHTAMSDTDATPIESLNGMQYLQLLPTNIPIIFQVKLASDSKANTSLMPLYNLNFDSVNIIGNYSNPTAKEIDVSQLTNLNIAHGSSVSLTGDMGVSYGSGLTNQQLKTISPWLINFATNSTNKTANINTINLSNSNITDFTPLKGLENAQKIIITADTPVHLDYTPIYAVDNHPITFTAKPVLGLDGDDLASGYHFSNSVPQQYLTEENLTNLGNDNYRLDHPTPGAQVLTYGYLGFGYSSNPANYVNKNYGNATLQYYIFNGQPLIWQEHPSLIVNYLGLDRQPLTIQTKTIDKLVTGQNIGDAYDLTPISQVPGYTLTSPETLLKGTFTQDPQIINLIYKKITHLDDEESGETGSTVPATSTSTPAKKPLVQVYDKEGQPVVNKHININNQLITASIHKKGQTFYQFNTDQWVLSNDFYAQKTTQKNIRTFYQGTALVNAQGKVLSTSLAANSEWKILKVVMIAGQKYYEVAPNEFILAANAVEFTPQVTKLHLTSDTMLYNSKGQLLKNDLKLGSNWSSDGYAIINHQKMYRVADDEWLPASKVYSYQPIKQAFHTTTTTTIFNLDGKPLPKKLKAQTTWQVDQLVTIDGLSYYRIATDEFVRA